MALHIPTRSDIRAYVCIRVYVKDDNVGSTNLSKRKRRSEWGGKRKVSSRRARALVGRRKIIAFYVWVRRQAWAADKFGRMEGEKE